MRGMILCWQPGFGNALAGRITDADFGELVVRSVRLKPKSLSWIETVREGFPALYSILEKGSDDDHECVKYFILKLFGCHQRFLKLQDYFFFCNLNPVISKYYFMNDKFIE